VNDLLALSRDLPHRDQELPLPALFDELHRDHHATLADAGRRLSIRTPGRPANQQTWPSCMLRPTLSAGRWPRAGRASRVDRADAQRLPKTSPPT
jgi:hypothetical protein